MRVHKDDITQYWQWFQQGHQEGLSFFLDKYYPSLCYFANRFVKDREAAEDIVSESLVNIWKKKEAIASSLAFKNYCYTAVRHACLRWLENQQRLQQHIQNLPSELYTEETALQNIIRTETIEELHAAIQSLPPKSSKVFTKLYVEGKSVAETAKELQVTISTVKSHKKTGLAFLRGMLTRVLLSIVVVPFL
ncbi:MAG: RNA polymerase sigma-70 factor [Chitinophagaceae bacterium]|nr:RNA polymerase sigma-70 factor [Chitinophagaceae bacterium]MCW5925581.1 RNA polymerase sigma-70 factor [Chitinophagaceae bacterium]